MTDLFMPGAAVSGMNRMPPGWSRPGRDTLYCSQIEDKGARESTLFGTISAGWAFARAASEGPPFPPSARMALTAFGG